MTTASSTPVVAGRPFVMQTLQKISGNFSAPPVPEILQPEQRDAIRMN
jgi:hypothetical protein